MNVKISKFTIERIKNRLIDQTRRRKITLSKKKEREEKREGNKDRNQEQRRRNTSLLPLGASVSPEGP